MPSRAMTGDLPLFSVRLHKQGQPGLRKGRVLEGMVYVSIEASGVSEK